MINTIKEQFEDNFLLTEHILYRNDHGNCGYGFHNIDNYENSDLSIESFFHENIKEDIKNYPYSIISKTIDWRDELEFRVVVYDKNQPNIYAKINNAVEKIIFGINTDKEYIRIIKTLYPQIELHQLNISSDLKVTTNKIN